MTGKKDTEPNCKISQDESRQGRGRQGTKRAVDSVACKVQLSAKTDQDQYQSQRRSPGPTSRRILHRRAGLVLPASSTERLQISSAAHCKNIPRLERLPRFPDQTEGEEPPEQQQAPSISQQNTDPPCALHGRARLGAVFVAPPVGGSGTSSGQEQ